jgi:hypothetical protein
MISRNDILEGDMAILVRDEKIERQVRELAKRDGLTLQGAIGMAVERELACRAEKQTTEATRRAQEMVAGSPVVDDGMTHRETSRRL